MRISLTDTGKLKLMMNFLSNSHYCAAAIRKTTGCMYVLIRDATRIQMASVVRRIRRVLGWGETVGIWQEKKILGAMIWYGMMCE